MKKIGVVCDNYKVAIFELAFKKGNFVYSIKPGLTKDLTAIHVMCPGSRLEELTALLHKADIEVALDQQKN